MVARALWALLAALRAGWCLLPQSGYLHPDEFFQAPEVMAGKACARAVVASRGLEGTRSRAATGTVSHIAGEAGVPEGSRSVTQRVPQAGQERYRRAGRVDGFLLCAVHSEWRLEPHYCDRLLDAL